jgi:hypothetical protein
LWIEIECAAEDSVTAQADDEGFRHGDLLALVGCMGNILP